MDDDEARFLVRFAKKERRIKSTRPMMTVNSTSRPDDLI